MTDTNQLAISRRTLLAGAAALGGSALLPADLAFAASPAKTLRIATGEADGVKGTLDPAFGTNDPDAARTNLVFEGLVRLTETFDVQPHLAAGWKTNADGSVWTFALRPNVKFHDGSPLTAADVIFSFRRLFDPKTPSPSAAWLAPINPDAIKAADDLTVEFTLRQPVVEFPELIAYSKVVKAGQSNEQLRTAGIGTGPFKVVRFVPGEEPGIYDRHEQYWQPGKPGVDRVEMRSVPEESARIAALIAGQIDIFWDLPLRGLNRLEQDKNVVIQSAHTGFWLGIAAWTDTPPFDNPKVRQALKLAANRQQLLTAVLGGRGKLGNDSPVPPWVKFGLEATQREQDIAQAKTLLAEAGHPDGVDLELYTSASGSGLVELATAYKAQAEAAGIRIKINQAPAEDYWNNIWLKKPFLVTAWSGKSADAALARPFLSHAEWNETHWNNKQFDDYIFEARRTLDETKRGELYRKAQELVRDDGGAIVSLFADAVGGTRANIKGWKLHPQKLSQSFTDVTIEG
ncbi:MAG: ABC transporter substrate-binding protein [Dongiaceae bacterium]